MLYFRNYTKEEYNNPINPHIKNIFHMKRCRFIVWSFNNMVYISMQHIIYLIKLAYLNWLFLKLTGERSCTIHTTDTYISSPILVGWIDHFAYTE